MSDEAPRKSTTIKQLFQELGDYLERTSPPGDVEAGWARLKRRIEEEQTPERPWQRGPFQPGEDVVLELGTNDVIW